MTDEMPEVDATVDQANGSTADERQVSRLALVVAILVMLLPATVPLYFAFYTEGTMAAILFATSLVVAVLNTLMVYGVWTWANRQSSPPA